MFDDPPTVKTISGDSDDGNTVDSIQLTFTADNATAFVSLECDVDSLGKTATERSKERFNLRYAQHTAAVKRTGNRYYMSVLSSCACAGATQCGISATPQPVPCEFPGGMDLTGVSAAPFSMEALERDVTVIAGRDADAASLTVRDAAVAQEKAYMYVVGFCKPTLGLMEGRSPCSKAPGSGFVQQFSGDSDRGLVGDAGTCAARGVCYKDYNGFVARGRLPDRSEGVRGIPFAGAPAPPKGVGADGGVWLSSRDLSYIERNRTAVVRVWCGREAARRPGTSGGHGVSIGDLRSYARVDPDGRNVVMTASATGRAGDSSRLTVLDFTSPCACRDPPTYCATTAAAGQAPTPPPFPCYIGGGIGSDGTLASGATLSHGEVIHLDGPPLYGIHRLDAVQVSVRDGDYMEDDDRTEVLMSMCRPILPNASGMPKDPCDVSPGPGYVQMFDDIDDGEIPTCMGDFNAHGRIEFATGGVSLISEDWAFAAHGSGTKIMNITILCDRAESDDLAYDEKATSQLLNLLTGRINNLEWNKKKAPPRMVMQRSKNGGSVVHYIMLRSRCACPGVCPPSPQFSQMFGAAPKAPSAAGSLWNGWGWLPSVSPELYSSPSLFGEPSVPSAPMAPTWANAGASAPARGAWLPRKQTGDACRVRTAGGMVDLSGLEEYQFELRCMGEKEKSTWIVAFCDPVDEAVFGRNPCSMGYAAHYDSRGDACHQTFNSNFALSDVTQRGDPTTVRMKASVRSTDDLTPARTNVIVDIVCAEDMVASPFAVRLARGFDEVPSAWEPPLPDGPSRNAARALSNLTYSIRLQSKCACPNAKCTPLSQWGAPSEFVGGSSNFVAPTSATAGAVPLSDASLAPSAAACRVDDRDLSSLGSVRFAAREIGGSDELYLWYVGWCQRREESTCSRVPGPGYVMQTALPPATVCYKDFNTQLLLESASAFDGVVLKAVQGAHIGGRGDSATRSVRVEVECDRGANEVVPPTSVSRVNVSGEANHARYVMRMRSKCACKGACKPSLINGGAASGSAGALPSSPWPAIVEEAMRPTATEATKPRTTPCLVNMGSRTVDLSRLGVQALAHTVGDCNPAYGAPRNAQWVFDFCKEVTAAPSGYDACSVSVPMSGGAKGKALYGFAHVVDKDGRCMLKLDEAPLFSVVPDTSDRNEKVLVAEFATREAVAIQKQGSGRAAAALAMDATLMGESVAHAVRPVDGGMDISAAAALNSAISQMRLRAAETVASTGAEMYFKLRVHLHCNRHLTRESGLSIHSMGGDAGGGRGVEETVSGLNHTWTLSLATCAVCQAGCGPKPPSADPCGSFRQIPLREIPTLTLAMQADHNVPGGRKESGSGEVYRWVVSPCRRISEPPIGTARCPLSAASAGFVQTYDEAGRWCYKDYGSRVEMRVLASARNPSAAFKDGSATDALVASEAYGGVALSVDDHRVTGKGRRQAVVRILCDPRKVGIALRPLHVSTPVSLLERALPTFKHTGSVCGAQTWTLDFSSPCACEGSAFEQYCATASASPSQGQEWTVPSALLNSNVPALAPAASGGAKQWAADVKAFCHSFGGVPPVKLRVRPTMLITPPTPADVQVSISLCEKVNVFDTPCSNAMRSTGGAFAQIYAPAPRRQCVDIFDELLSVDTTTAVTTVQMGATVSGATFSLDIVCDMTLGPNVLVVEDAHTKDYDPEPLNASIGRGGLLSFSFIMRSRCACKGGCSPKSPDPRPKPPTIKGCPAALAAAAPVEFRSSVVEEGALNETYTWVVGLCHPIVAAPAGVDLCTRDPGPGYVQSYRPERGWCIRDFNSGGSLTRGVTDGVDSITIEAFDGNTGEAKHRTVTVTLLCANVPEPVVVPVKGPAILSLYSAPRGPPFVARVALPESTTVTQPFILSTTGTTDKYVSAGYDHTGTVHFYNIVIKHPAACVGARIQAPPPTSSATDRVCKDVPRGVKAIGPSSFDLLLRHDVIGHATRRAHFDVAFCKRIPRQGPCRWQRGFVHQTSSDVVDACIRSFRRLTTAKPLAPSGLGGAGWTFAAIDEMLGGSRNIATVNLRCGPLADRQGVVADGSDPRLWWNPKVPAVLMRAANESDPAAGPDEREYVYEFVSPCACGPCSDFGSSSFGFVSVLAICMAGGVCLYFVVRIAKNLFDGTYPVIPHYDAVMRGAALIVGVGTFVVGVVVEIALWIWTMVWSLAPSVRRGGGASTYSLAEQDDDGSNDGDAMDGITMLDDEDAL